MKIPSNKFRYWWNLGVIHTKGHLLGFALCLFVCGLIVGLTMLLAVQSYQMKALRDTPVNLRGVAFASETATQRTEYEIRAKILNKMDDSMQRIINQGYFTRRLYDRLDELNKEIKTVEYQKAYTEEDLEKEGELPTWLGNRQKLIDKLTLKLRKLRIERDHKISMLIDYYDSLSGLTVERAGYILSDLDETNLQAVSQEIMILEDTIDSLIIRYNRLTEIEKALFRTGADRDQRRD